MPWDNKNEGPWGGGNNNPWGKKNNNGSNGWNPKNKGDDLDKVFNQIKDGFSKLWIEPGIQFSVQDIEQGNNDAICRYGIITSISN